MNIIVSPFKEEGYQFRPDSSLIRTLDYYFIPDFVDSISLYPALFIQTFRAGKSLSPEFVHRYLKNFSLGILLKPELSPIINKNRDFISNALDYTTIIPNDNYDIDTYSRSKADNFSIKLNGTSIFNNIDYPDANSIYEKISSITQFSSLKIGDFIAFVLSPTSMNLSTEDEVSILKENNPLINFTIK